MPNLLVVESDEMQQELLLQLLALRFEDYQIYGAERAQGAIELLEQARIDLLISASELADMPATDLARHAHASIPPVPVMVLAEDPGRLAELADREEVQSWLAKPLDADRFLAEVERQVNRTKRRPVYNMSLPGLLQVLGESAENCCLTILSETEKGRLYLENGQLVHAATLQQTGVDAFRAMIGWTLYFFETAPASQAPEQTIHGSLTSLLLDAAVHQDEASANSGEGS